jgi:HK97 family phage major capsid protein
MSGQLFTRFVRSLVVAKGDELGAAAFALGQNWIDSQEIVRAHKAAVSGITSAEFATAIAPISLDFAEFIRPRTIVGRLTGVRRLPLRTRVVMQTDGATAAFTPEGEAIPVSRAEFDKQAFLVPAACNVIVVISDELARNSTPAAETILAADVGRGIELEIDREFTDPTRAPSADQPGSIFHNSTEITSTGSSVAAIDADFDQLVHALTDSDVSIDSAVWVMGTHTAGYLGRLRSSGVLAYAGLGPRGGELLGLPVLVSRALDQPGSPGSALIGLLDQDSVLIGDENAARITVSQQAAIQMNTTPSDGPQPLLSMFPNSLTAVRATRFIRWQRRRDAGAAYMFVGY